MPKPSTPQDPFVDQDACTGCEACVASTPKVFRLTALGLAEVHHPRGDTAEHIQEAMDGCPASCIHWKG